MISDRILVFVDALPWDERDRITAALPAMSFTRPVEPGFGYSVNVKSELFAGLSPDDAGFLNEWTHRPRRGALRLPVPRLVDRLLAGRHFHGKVARKLLGKALGENVRNIPLHLLRHLGRSGDNAYERAYQLESLFTDGSVGRYLYSEHGGDDGALAALLQRLEEDDAPVSAFLATAHLDHVMHAHGLGTDAYEDAVEAACRMIRSLWEALEARGRDGALCLVSDHGMAPVTRSVSVDLESRFPGAGQRYGYFVDATMLRVWCDDTGLLSELRDFIAEQEIPGRELDADERARWGVSSPEFGDVLLLLDEGVMFAPSFMGRDACSAMHGYLPSLDSQRGLLACTVPLSVGSQDGSVPARRIYGGFAEWFGRDEDRPTSMSGGR